MNDVVAMETPVITRQSLQTIQINLGNRCNQACVHCHVGASPAGDRNMNNETAGKIIATLRKIKVREIEFTGGTPEMNPNFERFLRELSPERKISVRTSLTVLALPEYSRFIDLYRELSVRLVCSFPSAFESDMDRQRGKGAFRASVEILKRLNEAGFGTNGRVIDIACNPVGDYLPANQKTLEEGFRNVLKNDHKVSFNNLAAIVNAPVNRFAESLERKGNLEGYMETLAQQFNPDALKKVMCRSLLSVDYQGNIFDCDFHQAASIPVKGYEGRKFWDIDFDNFSPDITFAGHCYSCTANEGSSCGGALVDCCEETRVRSDVKRYYGEELQSSDDLKTNACCTAGAPPKHIRDVLPYIHDEIKKRYYGCGSPIPLAVQGLVALDLGCGTGRDAFILSKLTGEQGFVHGLDMTENQIAVARKYRLEQAERFGYAQPNTEFHSGYIEDITKIFPEATFDLVVSNCVINLVENKEEVFKAVFRSLKPGGEFYFSDIYADRRLAPEIRKDQLLYGECLGGALYEKDFIRMARNAGFVDPRVISRSVVEITDEGVLGAVGAAEFSSVTYRLWKLDGLEDACEDFGHVVVYKGNLSESPARFELDDGHVFEKNRPERVCGNTALMLGKTRFREFFDVIGNFDEHFGEFSGCEVTRKNEGERQTASLCC